jgi:hypothetical protein
VPNVPNPVKPVVIWRVPTPLVAGLPRGRTGGLRCGGQRPGRGRGATSYM